MRVYPNPNSGEFVIESKLTIKYLEIFSHLGYPVYNKDLNVKTTNLNLNLSKGVYYIKARLESKNGEMMVIEKMIIR